MSVIPCTDYKLLGILKRQFPKVPLLGLTATATSSVLKDCEKILCVKDPIILTAPFNRVNLYYEVITLALTQSFCQVHSSTCCSYTHLHIKITFTSQCFGDKMEFCLFFRFALRSLTVMQQPMILPLWSKADTRTNQVCMGWGGGGILQSILCCLH